MTQKEALNVLSLIADHSNSVSEEMYFSVLNENYNTVTAKLRELAIEFEHMGDSIICIKETFYDEYQITAYCSLDGYFRKHNDTENVILILGNKDIESLVSITNDNYTCFKHINNESINHSATNYFYLKKIIDLLSNPQLTDYKDTAYERYLFLSPECGKLEIYSGGLNNLIQIAQSEINLFETYLKFASMNLYQKGWEYILKNKIIKGLENVDIEKEGFKQLIMNLSLFVHATERDYELFLNSRKHESIVQQFENEKYLFAEKIRNILYRISGSIITIPLTFFGAAFAMKEINEIWLLNIIIFSMIIYIIFSSAINFLFWGDLDMLKNEMNTKIEITSMGLIRLSADLEKMIKPLFKRICFLKILIIVIIILFALLFIFFVIQYTGSNVPIRVEEISCLNEIHSLQIFTP